MRSDCKGSSDTRPAGQSLSFKTHLTKNYIKLATLYAMILILNCIMQKKKITERCHMIQWEALYKTALKHTRAFPSAARSRFTGQWEGFSASLFLCSKWVVTVMKQKIIFQSFLTNNFLILFQHITAYSDVVTWIFTLKLILLNLWRSK